MARVFICGAGIWGLTMARLIAENVGMPVTVIDRRPHIGGNSWSYFDAETGIECHKYGSHIFHTPDRAVWDFVTRFGDFTGYRHKVLAVHAGKVYMMPIGLSAINALYNLNLNPEQAKSFIAAEAAKEHIEAPANLEEKALSQIGRPLYEAFIRHYTAKQWEREPASLPAGIIARLPVRCSYDVSYFSDTWQGVPTDGYAKLFENMAKHPLIEIRLNCPYAQIQTEIPQDCRVIYTGLPDELFGREFGPLEWRSLRFEWETLPLADFQGTAVMNYTDAWPAFTRIHEFKHYNPERLEIFAAPKTVICREYPAAWQPGAEAYYPVPTERNLNLYERYAQEAARAGIVLGGRLGGYKYLDMDKSVADAMRAFEKIWG